MLFLCGFGPELTCVSDPDPEKYFFFLIFDSVPTVQSTVLYVIFCKNVWFFLFLPFDNGVQAGSMQMVRNRRIRIRNSACMQLNLQTFCRFVD